MNVSGVIDKIPAMDPKERQRVQQRAWRWLELGPAKAAAAKEVLNALAAAEAREQEALVRHVAGLGKSERIVEAFKKLPMSESEMKVI